MQVIEETRRVLTRDLLVRAAHARNGAAQDLRFRVLHLNLSLIADTAARLGLTAEQLAEAEHLAIDGLLDAVRAYDPYDEPDFDEVASSYLERSLLRRPVSSRTAPASPR